MNSLLDSFDLIDGLSTEDQTRMEAEGKFIPRLLLLGRSQNVRSTLRLHTGQQPSGHSIADLFARCTIPARVRGLTYDQIEADLNDAIAGLPEDNGKYATKDAARALLAQVHFLKMEFEAAAAFGHRSH